MPSHGLKQPRLRRGTCHPRRRLIPGLLASLVTLGVVGLGCGEQSAQGGGAPAGAPRLVGLTPTEAREKAENAGLVLEVTAVDPAADSCLQLPPRGRVAAQAPAAGERLRRSVVRVEIACGVVQRPCQAKELKLRATAEGGVFPGGGNAVGFELVHTGPEPCRLRGAARLALVDSLGEPLGAVAGNPVSLGVERRLGVGQVMSAGYAWYGCPPGLQGRARAVVRVAGSRSAARAPTPPCLERASRLEPVSRDPLTLSVDRARYLDLLASEQPSWARTQG